MLQDRGFLGAASGGWQLDREATCRCPSRCRASSPRASTRSRAARRRCSRTRPSPARSSGSARSRRSGDARCTRSTSRCTRSSGRSSCAASAARPSAPRRSTRSATSLVRDVAYNQIPRAQRVDKHRLVAEWIESLAAAVRGPRGDARAPLLRRSTSLAPRASTTGARQPAPARARRGGERASRLYAIAAIIDLAQAALELTDNDDPARPLLEFRLLSAYQALGENRFDLGESARDGFLGAGDVESAALVELMLSRMSWLTSDIQASTPTSNARRR